MRYVKFKIKNFKGIQNLEIDFEKEPISHINALVGLNESGKTTILEALSFFYESTSSAGKEVRINKTEIEDPRILIPKAKKSNFNEKIRISASLVFTDSEYGELEKTLREKGFAITKGKDTQIEYSVEYDFENSILKTAGKSTYINNDFEVAENGKRKGTDIYKNKDLWTTFCAWVTSKMPPIIYYLNFLFDLPEKIYLEEYPGEKADQLFYRRFFDDVLESVDSSLSVEKHIIDRVKNDDSQNRDIVEQIFNRISTKITSIVFNEQWNVLNKSGVKKSVSVRPPIYDSGKQKYYVEIKVKDGNDSYFLSERSLGFRWLFIFLLLTQFRVMRKDTIAPVFLLDEPASNLHSAAQNRIRFALDRLTEKSSSRVIFATHSHHLISPDWLENTFVVRNTALAYDENEDNYTNYMTNISLIRYRQFVSENPTLTTYFQPILDLLDYVPSNLELIPKAVMVEGKNDYYTLKFIFSLMKVDLAVMPSGGSSSLDNLISLYLGWSRHFAILLDSDKAGLSQKTRYIEKFGIFMEDRTFTYLDIDSSWQKTEMETLFDGEDRLKIQQTFFPDETKFDKKLFNLAIQEALLSKRSLDLSEITLKNFNKVFEFLRDRLK
jgi:predicted ATP-dependent endonuclease of OLD family